MIQTTIPYIQLSFSFLENIIKVRIKDEIERSDLFSMELLNKPYLNGSNTAFTEFLRTHQLNDAEYITLLIALVPHVQPHFFDNIIQQHLPKAGDFPQIGGVRGKNFRGFLPTMETILFILAGSNMEERFKYLELFNEEHFFAKHQILSIEDAPTGEPRAAGKIILANDYVELFTQGKFRLPKFSTKFPAQLLHTDLEWSDLVLNEDTLNQIKELEIWIEHHKTLLEEWGMRKKLKPGYRVLFYGPPGTGKTLTATLLGKYTQKQVFKIDLSMVVSKFIGETEKNLAQLFAKAEHKDWILFFDEADALFGKRTNVKDAHDKYANQETAYLLQRVEGYNGMVILASNFRNNIDDAFIRRFQSIIHFPLPKSKERLQLWQKGFPPMVKLHTNVSLNLIAQKYELSGAEIMNVVQYCCLMALTRSKPVIEQKDILAGIQKEFLKEGRIMR